MLLNSKISVMKLMAMEEGIVTKLDNRFEMTVHRKSSILRLMHQTVKKIMKKMQILFILERQIASKVEMFDISFKFCKKTKNRLFHANISSNCFIAVVRQYLSPV